MTFAPLHSQWQQCAFAVEDVLPPHLIATKNIARVCISPPSARLAVHLLASALLPATAVLLSGYVATSPALARAGLAHRIATAKVLALRGQRRMEAEVGRVLAEAPTLQHAQAVEVARLRLAAVLPGIEWESRSQTAADGALSRWWVTTGFGYPYLDEVTPRTSHVEPTAGDDRN